MAVLQANIRTASSTSGLKELRRQGLVPMAIVEKGKGTVLVQAPERDLRRALSYATGGGQFQIQLDGEPAPRKVLLKQVEKNYLANKLLHVAVLQVQDTDVVTIDLPVVTIGTPGPVLRHEATVIHPMSHVKVKGQLQAIPDHFEVDISELELHGSVTCAALQMPPGVELLSAIDSAIAVVAPIVHEAEPEVAEVEGEPGEVPTVQETEGGAESEE